MEEQAKTEMNTLDEKLEKKKKGKKKIKKWPFILGGVILVIIILAVWGYNSMMNKVTEMADGNETVVQKYGMHDMSTYVSATGTVRSANVEYVSTTLQYQIDELKVEVGDRVKSGDTVCLIDTDAINDKIDDLEAQASDEEVQSAKQIQIAKSGILSFL